MYVLLSIKPSRTQDFCTTFSWTNQHTALAIVQAEQQRLTDFERAARGGWGLADERSLGPGAGRATGRLLDDSPEQARGQQIMGRVF